ncbi:energy-coupling factor transporter transmembrane component T family protein [Paenibacillus radicis (ex Gao et al. 2016)]|uniref:ABC transporter permease n=1 Tax=Paenibacillus radicis (ex Gao et al. 2016) TaxID=1737354 RepID=A0A917HL64_9BACL|nr:energy-coupling factor transporter transmembrane component T [Paenibacillus radicis (ex Gao et al. 2016)]GGG83215.1 ABC transporter permease [Paenibacillus radicis (ex Gao et al. 2016)]
MQLYYPSNSIIHYMHGFSKILIFGILLTLIPLFMEQPISLLLLLFLCAALFSYIRPPKTHLLLLIPVGLLAVMMSTTYFFADMGGQVYLHMDFGYWMFQISSGNILFAVTFILRMMIWSLLFFILLFTTSPEDLVIGLKRFGLPEFLTLAVSLALRYWSLMIFDVKTVMDAQYCRGVDFRSGGLLTRTKRFASLLIPVLFVFLKRFRTTSFALTLKGVGRKNKRTYYYNPRLSAIDSWAISSAALLTAAWLTLQWLYKL